MCITALLADHRCQGRFAYAIAQSDSQSHFLAPKAAGKRYGWQCFALDKSGEVDHVRLTHRSQPDDLLLMRASAVSQMQSELAALRTRLAPDLRPLAGLGTLTVSDEELLADLAAARAQQSHSATYKQRELERGLRSPEQARLDRVAEKARAVGSVAKAPRRKRAAE